MESNTTVISEEWIRKKLNITHDNLEDIKSLSLPGTYHEKISHLGNSFFKFTRLKELDLSRNSLISLEGLENLKHLEKLNLYYNNISTLKELERLRYNTSLTELDLRLNPITKEENDYRLFLIHILPSLKSLDDRAIRESERQMAQTYFEQSTSGMNGNGLDHKMHGYDSFHNGNPAIAARIKSVSNIAKRSAGLSDADEANFENGNNLVNLHNFLNLRIHENGMNGNGCDERKNRPQVEEYSPRTLKEMGNLESQSYSTLNVYNNNSNINSNTNGNSNQNDAAFRDFRSKSCSMLNLRTINEPNLKDNNLNLIDETDIYSNHKSRGSFTPNPFYDQSEDEKKSRQQKEINEENGSNEEQKNNNPIFTLLDLVDRYWNGSKSLHKNYKFLGAANQLLAQYMVYNSEQNIPDEQSNMLLHQQLKLAQEENRRLQQQLTQKSKSPNENDSDSQYKNIEIDSLKKKLITAQEENKKLRKEMNEKSDKLYKEYSLDSIENQNSSMKREIEIMKIKLKQYEQLQQLTAMLQESHKSLVTTNEHLLQEINSHKYEKKQPNGRFLGNDMNLYESSHEAISVPLFQISSNGQISQQNLPVNQKLLIRKQMEQLNNSVNSNGNNNRFAYSTVK